jgi:hypothetical protein
MKYALLIYTEILPEGVQSINSETCDKYKKCKNFRK